MTSAYIVCSNCDNDFCYCSDTSFVIHYAWGFEPLVPVHYPHNLLWSTLGEDEDLYVEFWFDTHESFQPILQFKQIILEPRQHPLTLQIAELHRQNNW
jgi:hypothetical protein